MRYDACMSKTIQIRDVDDRTYTVLRMRASAEGLSLTLYLKRELDRLTNSPTMAEWLGRATDRDWGVDRDVIVRTVHQVRDEDET